MPTLQDVTREHSRRISSITQRRDRRLQAAADRRDQRLRALPAAARLYDAFDAQLADARQRQAATDGKAEAARTAALQSVSDALRAALDKAHRIRRDADTAAFEKRRAAEDDAEHEFILAIAAAPGKPSTEAQRVRAEKLDKAKKAFETALTAAQDQFRQSREAALIAEGEDARDAHRAYANASKVSEASTRAARATAEQKLAKALAAVPAAADEFDAWRRATTSIVADYRREEEGEFERFHREMEALKG
jgi:hypothetical protein